MNKLKIYKAVLEILKESKGYMGFCQALTQAIIVDKTNCSNTWIACYDSPFFKEIWSEVTTQINSKDGKFDELYQYKPENNYFSPTFIMISEYWFDPLDSAIRIKILEEVIEKLENQS